MTVEIRNRPQYEDNGDYKHLVIQVEVTGIDDAPHLKHPGGSVEATVTGRAQSPGYTFTRLEKNNGDTFLIVFNEQTLEEFYLAHKLVIERTKQNGTD